MNKNNLIWNILGLLSTVLLCLLIYFAVQITTLNQTTNDLNEIEYLNSSTQRLVRLALSNNIDKKTVYYINNKTVSALTPGGSDSLSVLVDADLVELGLEICNSWGTIATILSDDTINTSNLSLAAENHYYQMTDLSQSISYKTSIISLHILNVGIAILVVFVMLGAIVAQNILQTRIALKHSKALTKSALLDNVTGLYNRSKCQELFKNNAVPKCKKQPALILVDLQKLKITNDISRRRIENEMFNSFANALNSATAIHMSKPFIARYSHNEFIIFYDDMEDVNDINLLVKELAFLTNELNKQTKYQISYSLGYAIDFKNDTTHLSIRQLFDKAANSIKSDAITEVTQEIING